VFDDPSLAAMSYGCIDYEELARAATTHRFHAAIATIPIDAHRASRRVATLFRNHPEQLSLVPHGNNHVRLELARARDGTLESLLAQALRRVQRLESRHHLNVCRIMEPPYGVVSDQASLHLSALGYEGILITAEEYLRWNRTSVHPATFGMEVAGCLFDGTGTLPRRLFGRNSETEALLCAFLGQPLVFAGHHDDARDRMHRLTTFADRINALGDVRWQRLEDIVRSNYQMRCEQDQLVVRVCARRVMLQLPSAREVVIERPWITEGSPEPLVVRMAGAPDSARLEGRHARLGSPLHSHPIEVLSPHPAAREVGAIASPRPSLWPVFRRTLTETRDRLYPLLKWRAAEDRR
jgi:hypothetical protein